MPPSVLSDQSDRNSRASTAKLSHLEDGYLASVFSKSLARTETQVVNFLRVAVLVVLLITGALVSTTVYMYTQNQEHERFVTNFEHSATQVIEAFHSTVERNLAAIAFLSNTITSHAKYTNTSFPFVTLPDFELRGSDLRAISGSYMVYWCPLITDQTRDAWEDYALENRYHTTESFALDTQYRAEQDLQYQRERKLVDINENLTTLDDGYHPKLWSNGATSPRGDEPQGDGAQGYLSLWQQSPVDAGAMGMLNLNIARIQIVHRNMLERMVTEKKALINQVAETLPLYKPYMEHILSLSQYREDVDRLADDLHTIFAYPVFDSFENDNAREMTGILATDIHWKSLLSDLLPDTLDGIICVIENSVNQSFAYRIDGPTTTFLGMNYQTDANYGDLEIATNVNAHLKERAGPRNRAYKTVGVSDAIQYTIRIFPSQDTEDLFVTNKPAIYTAVSASAFAFCGLLFLLYSYVVERRQHLMAGKVIDNIQKAAETERELNEFLSHEVRNPLSAAISACTFVSAAVNEEEPFKEKETINYVREDIDVVNSSLHFINDFMRSMLDVYRINDNKISVHLAPADVLKDILEPVANIVYKRLATFEVVMDCPPNLFVMTDSIRLKQVVLNLCRNSAKFVERGFLRLVADVVRGQVRICVEDSGPGIPFQKRKELFSKYQESLDLLSQGTGIGLNLSKKLMRIMDGDLWFNNKYDSGVVGCPGACFVVELKKPPMDIEASFLNQEVAGGGGDGGVSTHSLKEEKELESILPAESANESTINVNGDEIGDEKLALAPACHPTAVDTPQPNLEPGPGLEDKKENTPDPETEEKAELTLPDNLSLLFVDDDALLRKLFSRAVKRVAPPSWKIQDASSGEMALKLCETETFDLMFLDQYMASVDKQLLGTETAQLLRSKGITCKICGLSANELRDAFLAAGANDFVLKPMPCKPDVLKQLLLRLLFPPSESAQNVVAKEP